MLDNDHKAKIRYLESHGCYFGGIQKCFIGEWSLPDTRPWHNVLNVIGFYQKVNGEYEGFITGSERGHIVMSFHHLHSVFDAIDKLYDYACHSCYVNMRVPVMR